VLPGCHGRSGPSTARTAQDGGLLRTGTGFASAPPFPAGHPLANRPRPQHRDSRTAPPGAVAGLIPANVRVYERNSPVSAAAGAGCLSRPPSVPPLTARKPSGPDVEFNRGQCRIVSCLGAFFPAADKLDDGAAMGALPKNVSAVTLNRSPGTVSIKRGALVGSSWKLGFRSTTVRRLHRASYDAVETALRPSSSPLGRQLQARPRGGSALTFKCGTPCPTRGSMARPVGNRPQPP